MNVNLLSESATVELLVPHHQAVAAAEVVTQALRSVGLTAAVTKMPETTTTTLQFEAEVFAAISALHD